MSIEPTYSGECQFVTYADSSKGGPRITLRLRDRDELEAFIGMEGKRFALVLVQIGDDEQPVPPRQRESTQTLGPLAMSAVMMCKEPRFRSWLGVSSPVEAAEFIKRECGISSRKELDTNPVAARKFRTMIVEPWREVATA